MNSFQQKGSAWKWRRGTAGGWQYFYNCFDCDAPNDVDQKVLTLNLNAKFYFLKNSSGSGPYAGAYVREDWLLSRRSSVDARLYIPEYYVNNQFRPVQSRSLRSGVGILAGYKLLLWKHLTLEASMGLDWAYRWLFGDRLEMDWNGIPSLKAGYRL